MCDPPTLRVCAPTTDRTNRFLHGFTRRISFKMPPCHHQETSDTSVVASRGG